MRLAVIAVGRLKDGPERELCERYRERGLALGRGIGLSGPDIVEITEGRGRRPEERKREEAQAILAKVQPGLIIGGADGLSEEIRDRADITLAFGALTIPHQIVRALVLEQLYRAMTIISGHPYHRV